LVKGTTYADDPAFLKAPFIGIGGGPRAQGQIIRPFRGGQGNQTPPAVRRISSSRFAQTLHEQPLEMLYQNLDKAAPYKVRILYGSGSNNAQIRLVANGKFEVQPLQRKPMGPEPVEFEIPAEASATGELRLTWTGAPGLGGDGRGVQVAEVWLVRNAPAPAPGRN
jgi:hypothetical protein